MVYVQHRPPTMQVLNVIRSILNTKFAYLIKSENYVLDLFCGNGNITCNLLDLINIKYLIGIDRNYKLIQQFHQRLQHTKIKHKLLCLDAFRFRFNQTFNIVFIDPPFKFNMCDNITYVLSKRKIINMNTLIIIRNLKKNKLSLINEKNTIINKIDIGQNQIIFMYGF